MDYYYLFFLDLTTDLKPFSMTPVQEAISYRFQLEWNLMWTHPTQTARQRQSNSGPMTKRRISHPHTYKTPWFWRNVSSAVILIEIPDPSPAGMF